MRARAVGSLIWTTFTGTTKLVTRLYLALRHCRNIVKKGKKVFYNSLIESGLPRSLANDIARTYAQSGLELLKVRRIIRIARDAADF